MAVVHLPILTLTNLLKIDDMTTNNKEDTVLVLDDMQQYVIQKTKLTDFIMQMCCGWRHRHISICLTCQ